MSQTIITSVPSARSGRQDTPILDRAVAAGATYLSGLRREWALSRDRRALEDMDDRGLADIGIGRGQVEGAIRHGRTHVAGTAPRPRPGAPLMPASWTEWR